MIIKTNKCATSTSFHSYTVSATLSELDTIFQTNYANETILDIKDKVQYEWTLELDNHLDSVFTVYDWKAFRHILKDEIIPWHIGSEFHGISRIAQKEINTLLANLRIKNTKNSPVMNTKPNLFQSVKNFINSKGVGNTFTTKELCAAMDGIETVTRWKSNNNNEFYRTHSYKTYLKRLGFISNIKRGLWKVDVKIPLWLDSGHVNIIIFEPQYSKYKSNGEFDNLYKGLTRQEIKNRLSEYMEESIRTVHLPNDAVRTINLKDWNMTVTNAPIGTPLNVIETPTVKRYDPIENFNSAVKLLASEIIGDGQSPNIWFVTKSSNVISEDSGFDERLPNFENEESTTYGPFYSYADACKKYESIDLSVKYGIGQVCIEDREIGVVKEKVFEKAIRIEYVEREIDDSDYYSK
jgi:hypothetical protein